MRGLRFSRLLSTSAGTHIPCLKPFLALGSFVLHRLVFIKRPEAFAGDIRVMDKQILTAVVGSDKTVPFPLAEPFYLAFTQFLFSLGHLGLKH